MKNYQETNSQVRLDRNTWLMVAAIMGGLMAVSSAQAQNLLLNPSFENGVTAKVQWGYSGGNGSQFDVPNWFTPGATAPTDTGVDNTGPAGRDGTYAGYLWGGDTTAGYAAQTTSYVIQSGDAFTLNLLGAPWTFDAGWAPADATVHYNLYYGGDATTMGTTFATGFFDLGSGNSSPFTTFSISGLTAPGAADGQLLGIAFYNSSGTGADNASTAAPDHSWLYIDNVSLSVAPVPEPTSAALLGLGTLTGILALRRRRA